jgi:WD40 repeat protein
MTPGSPGDEGLPRNPFPGPQPYRASDRARFFGREEMAYHLEGTILANACVTVYGPSGAGKSSLVQAAVLPALVDAHDVRVVRVDAWPEDQDPATWLADAAYGALGLGARPADLGPGDALLAAAERAALRSSRVVLIYLDQLEQLLHAGRSGQASAALFDALNRLVELPLRNLRVVLSLREDYLGRFRDRLRDHHRVLDHGFRVGPLSVGELCQAVCYAAASGAPPQGWEPEEMRPLLLQVRVPGQAESDEAEAQAAYAQIVCRALFQERAAPGGPAAAPGVVEAEPILRRYLEATLDALGDLRAAAQQLLEDHLVTGDGSRTLRTEKELLRVLPEAQLAPVLRVLEGAAILHAEAHQGSRYFEIGHDWLARRVFEQRQERERAAAERRREEERRRALEQERAQAAARLAREHAQRRRLGIIAALSVALAAGAGGLGFWAWQQKLAARASEAIAVKKQVEAFDARVIQGFHELSAHGQTAHAARLLAEVQRPAERRGWIGLAGDALDTSVPRVDLRGHEGALGVATWSPDGARVVTVSDDGTARVWSADGAGRPVVLRGHEGPVVVAAWSPDGARVVTGSADRTARVWSADGSGSPVVLAGHEGRVVAVAVSADGKRVLTASRDATARVWSLDGAGAPVVLKGHAGPLTAAVWSADGERVITASEDATARVWSADGKGAPLVLAGHTSDVLCVAVNVHDQRVVTTSRDRTARVWDGSGKGDLLVTLDGHEGSVTHAAWSPDGRRVVTASADRTARVWTVSSKEAPVVLAGHALSVTFVAWSPDGQYVATASADRTARLWPADGGTPLVLRGHDAPVRSATWDRSSQRVLTSAGDPTGASLDTTAKVWSTEERLRALPRLQKGAFHAASLAADGEILLTAHDDDTARLVRLGDAGALIVYRGHEGWVARAALSPDGSRVATASFDRTARIFPVTGKGEPRVLRGHEAAVRGVAWSADGARVVTASDDGTARVFAAGGGGEPVVLRGHEDWLTSASFSPDGLRVVTTSLDRTARVWRAGGGAPLAVLSGHGGDVYAAAWSPDGTRVMTAAGDHAARIFPAEGGAPRLLRTSAAALAVGWSPRGDKVAVAAADGTVRVWRADGEGAPIVLEAPAAVLTMVFLDDGEKLLAFAADGSAHPWTLDVDALRQRLRAASTDCLPPDVRAAYLGESGRAAHAAYRACERSYQRLPAAEGKVP